MTQPTTIGNSPGKGRIQYTLDPGIQPGKQVQTPDLTYTFGGVAAGQHIVRVELVNNDYTPLTPPVYVQIVITVPIAR